MIYLVLSLITSSSIFLLFKWFGQNNVNTFQAIVINYIVASAIGIILSFGKLDYANILSNPVFRNGAILGFLFIGLFFLMALISQRMGAGISSTATKLSLVIPTLFFIVINPNEPWTFLKILALALSIPGVILTVYQPSSERTIKLFLPFLLFAGSGILDITLAYTEQEFAHTDTDKILLTFTPFMVSAVVGIIYLSVAKQNTIKFAKTSIFYGAILGLINFGSIYYLLKTFEVMNLQKSQIIPMNNLGIVIMSALFAYLLLKERLNRQNKFGLIISLISIFLLILDSF